MLHNSIISLRLSSPFIFDNKSSIQIRNDTTFNNAKTKHIDINIDKYRIYKKDIDYKLLKIELPIFWKGILPNSFFIMNYQNNSVYNIFQNILEFKINTRIDIAEMKTNYLNTLEDNIKYLNKLLKYKSKIKDLYKMYGNNIFLKVKINDEIKTLVNDNNYNGILIDLLLLAKYYKLNLIVIRNRINKKFKFTNKVKNNETNNYIIVLMVSKRNKFNFHIVYRKNKNIPLFEFPYNKLPKDFIKTISSKITPQIKNK